MKKRSFIIILTLITYLSYSQHFYHNINVKINISENSLEAIDVISLPNNYVGPEKTIGFSINKNLNVSIINSDLKLELIPGDDTESNIRKYKISFKTDAIDKIQLKYSGKIYDKIETGAAEYARGFSETSGIIFEKGVYMAGSTHWIPEFDNANLITFSMIVKIDSAWNVVSQGERTMNKKEGNLSVIRYESPNPVDEIYLIAAPWTEYSVETDNVLVQAFLRTPDEELASRYLKATSGYLQLYNNLIGPYPYKKFALVENFWETGYGMPSFTLLGEKVIRFPWILHSSYPHELLHNYWGNSVYVDYESGNWCEGLTAYMADHLIKEQQGKGAEYRKTTLQKFTDFVNEENDFPVAEFRSRNNSAEEAIGYGKVLMINDMLRLMLGDSIFKSSYRYFYQNYKFKKASFTDIQTSFEAVSGQDLKPFFDQWLNRKGAPDIKLSQVIVKKKKGKYSLNFILSQIQKEDPFVIHIPVVVYLENQEFVDWKIVSIGSRETDFSFSYKNRPLKIEIDPQFNVFRKLDVNEVPPSLSQVQGSRKSKIILPKESALYEAYMKLANTWKETQKAQGKIIEIIDDSELENIPENESFWVLGKENKFAETVSIPDSYKNTLTKDVLESMKNANENASFVYVIQHPENKSITIAYIKSDTEAAINGLTRKLPHYGKYSYLTFEGDAPMNNLKGLFTAVNSPLNHVIEYEGENPEIKATIIPRKALASSYSKH